MIGGATRRAIANAAIALACLVSTAGWRTAAAADEPRVAYLNFDGATLELATTDDATENKTRIADMVGEYRPYGDDPAARAAILQAVAADWFPYNLIVTDRRPPSGHYMMSMIGPSSVYPEGTLGIAALDCNDDVEDDITFVFHHAGDGHTAATTAATTSQELGHAFGLEHVDEPTDIMNAANAGGDPAFTDACLPTFTPTPTCSDQHEAFCGTAGRQNAHAELLALLGPRGANAGGAPIEIVAPTEADRFAAGDTIDIRVEATEGFAIARAELIVGGLVSGTDDDAPFGFVATGVETGRYEFYVQAVDADGRIGVSAPVTVRVGVQTENRDDQAGLPSGFGTQGRGASSSGCDIAARGAPTPWLLALLIVAGPRRRPASRRRAVEPR